MGCIASLACTACTCCARATCCCCRLGGRAAGRAVGGGGDKEGRRRFSRRQRSVCAKVTYLVLLCLMVLVGVFVRLVGPDIYRDFYSFNTGCEGDATELDRCLSLFGAYRVSFATFAFFVLTAILVRLWRGFHSGLWVCKIVALIAFTAGAFFIPNGFFEVYSYISRVGSILFILLQLLIVVDFAFDLHEFLVGRANDYDEKLEADGYEANVCGNCWRVGYGILAIGCIVLGVGGIITMFAALPLCAMNVFYLATTLISAIFYTGMSMQGTIGRGLLPAGIVLLYSTYLCYSAISSNPSLECNPRAGDSSKDSLVVGIIIAAVSLTWTAFRTASNGYDVLICSGDAEDNEDDDGTTAGAGGGDVEMTGQDELNAALTEEKPAAAIPSDAVGAGAGDDGGARRRKRSAGAEAEEEEVDDEDPTAVPNDQRFWFFHLIMALGGLYMGMLLTNWGNTQGATLTANTELSIMSMWVKIVSMWLCVILYMWTLMAPVVCASRSFEDTHNAFA